MIKMIKIIQPKTILSFKNKVNKPIDNKLLGKINSLFLNADYKKNKKKNKKNNWRKTTNFEKKTNLLITDVNKIFNKLTINNFDIILNEFISNPIFFVKNNTKNICNNIWLKIIHDVNFIDLYLKFIIKIQKIINNTDLKIDFLGPILILTEKKFNLDFLNENNDIFNLLKIPNDINNKTQDYLFIYKINNLKIIFHLIKNKILSDNISPVIIKLLTKIDKTGEIIYNWFSLYNKIPENELVLLNNIIKNNNYSNRIQIILNNFIETNNVTTDNIITGDVTTDNVTTDNVTTNNVTYDIEIINIIEEYIYIKNLEEIKLYINENCKNILNKNIFCATLYHVWLTSSKSTGNIIYKLVNQLLCNKILYKSNFSSGLIMTYKNWDNINIDYAYAKKHIIVILNQLYKHNITNKINHLFKNYNITQN